MTSAVVLQTTSSNDLKNTLLSL